MNSINIIGLLKPRIDEYYRYFEYELPFDQEDNGLDHTIIIKYWTNLPDSRLLVLADNTRVALQGHLDTDKTHGTIIIVSEVQVIR